MMKIEKFLHEYKSIISERTRKSYRGFLTRFGVFLKERQLTLEAVHPADIEAFAAWCKCRVKPKGGKSGLSDVTVQSHLAAVSSYYQWLRCRKKAMDNPVASFKYRRREPIKKKSLIGSEIATAMSEQSGSELGNLIVKLLRGSGLRLSELISLDRRDLKFETCPGSKWKGPMLSVKVKGKGGKIRIVSIGMRAAKALMNYLRGRGEDREPALLTSRRKTRISHRTVQRLVHDAAAKVGASHSHPHELRHRFATDAIEGGLTERQLTKHLGQLSLDTTYRYIHVTADEVARQYKKAMDEVDKRVALPSFKRVKPASAKKKITT